MNSLKFKNIYKKYNDETTVVDDFNLEINDGEFLVFVGPSGCGKSTILRMIAGLESVTTGDIFLDDKNITFENPGKREIAMVFQSYALYPHMSVEKNMGFSLKMSGMPKNEIKKKISLAAKILQLENLLDRKPAELSGGQRQRVAIGRAIVRNPKLFLFDEPLSNLDAKLRVEMRLQITQLHKQLKNTMIYVTHDQVEAMTMADRIVVLRDGKIEQVGTPLELYHSPANIFVAGFIGSPKMNFIKVKLIASTNQNTTISLPCKKEFTLPHVLPENSEKSDEVTLGIRPEDIELSNDDANMYVDIETIEHLGSSTLIYSKYQSQSIVLNIQGTYFNEDSSTVGIKIKEDKCHLFTNEEKAFEKRI